MTKTLTLIAAMLTAAVVATPAHAEFGTNAERGYDTVGGGGDGGGDGCCRYTVGERPLNKMDFEVGERRARHTEGGGKLKSFGGSHGGPGSNPSDKTDGYGGGDSR